MIHNRFSKEEGQARAATEKYLHIFAIHRKTGMVKFNSYYNWIILK